MPQLGLLQTETQHGLHAVTTIYDSAGRPVDVGNGKGHTIRCYDLEGRLIASLAPGDTNPSLFSYDPNGNELTSSHAGTADDTEGTVSTSYDEAGRITATTDANGAAAAFSYDADGNRLSRTATVADTANSLGFSGNEITDSVRAANLQGDGLASPDSSTGIWQAATNLLTNGGFETDNSGWTTAAGWWNTAASSISRTSGGGEFGYGYALVTTAGSAANEGVRCSSISVTAGQPYTFSVWLKGSGTIKLGVGDGTVGHSASSSITLTGTWTRYSLTFTPTATASSSFASIFWAGTTAGSFSFDGAQVEQARIATPYVETDGAAATRAAGAVSGPASLLSASQGWVALRIRPQWSSTNPPAGGSQWEWLFDWRTDSSNRYSLIWDEAAHRFSFVRRVAGNSVTARSALMTLSPGAAHTVIAAWLNGTSIAISVDGAAFVSTTVSGTLTPSLSSFALGNDSPSNNLPRRRILWSSRGPASSQTPTPARSTASATATPTLQASPPAPPPRRFGTAPPPPSRPQPAATQPATATTTPTSSPPRQTRAAAATATATPTTAAAEPQAIQYPNSSYSLTETNPDGWVTAVCNDQGTVPTTPPSNGSCPTGATKIAEYTYSYNQDGSKSQETLAGPTTQTISYSYDPAGRLASYTIGSTTTSYCYDADSNRTTTNTSASCASPS